MTNYLDEGTMGSTHACRENRMLELGFRGDFLVRIIASPTAAESPLNAGHFPAKKCNRYLVSHAKSGSLTSSRISGTSAKRSTCPRYIFGS